MTLRRKMTWQIAATIVGLLLVGGAAVWGLDASHQDYGVALEGYERLRQVYEASSHLATAHKLLGMPHPRAVEAARTEIRLADQTLARLPPAAPGSGWDPAADAAVRAAMLNLVRRVDGAPRDPSPAEAEAQKDEVIELLAKIPQLAAGIRHTTEDRQQAAAAKRRATTWAVGLLAGAVVVGGTVLGVLQYLGVVRPLNRLAEGVRRIAAGQLTGRVEPRGGDEFASLANDFNRMAAELDGFYHELEQKVAAKSRELIRSERLASVGYLAAGVAHEINNPLGIISGYAEYSLQALRDRAGPARKPDGQRPNGHDGRDGAADGASDLERSLQVICDEAFRCKEITGKLLSLARPGDDNRRPVSLAAVADHVASIVGGLAPFRDRRLVVRAEHRDELVVNAVEAEMKQVLLNLTVNALEAVPPGEGEVRVDVRRDVGWVVLSVADNGRGMTPATLERVFEPFFTEKRGSTPGAHGTGLGLAITHAIVEAHGGRIEAHSDGPGKGSRFVVRLPAVV